MQALLHHSFSLHFTLNKTQAEKFKMKFFVLFFVFILSTVAVKVIYDSAQMDFPYFFLGCNYVLSVFHLNRPTTTILMRENCVCD